MGCLLADDAQRVTIGVELLRRVGAEPGLKDQDRERFLTFISQVSLSRQTGRSTVASPPDRWGKPQTGVSGRPACGCGAPTSREGVPGSSVRNLSRSAHMSGLSVFAGDLLLRLATRHDLFLLQAGNEVIELQRREMLSFAGRGRTSGRNTFAVIDGRQ